MNLLNNEHNEKGTKDEEAPDTMNKDNMDKNNERRIDAIISTLRLLPWRFSSSRRFGCASTSHKLPQLLAARGRYTSSDYYSATYRQNHVLKTYM
jgi:Ni/Co efflux regulator RcnB